ncbi:MAG: Ig-like domain-containing protein, partial [Acidobacteria bacterium]|nr:Ig-like domain-containing protein [Acidobacteriota bacterium]
STTRRAATIDALAVYPGFYHLQPVRVRGKLVTDQVGTALISGDTRLLLVGDASLGRADGAVEVVASFIDVGRLTPDDQRVNTYGLVALSQKVLQRDWPGPGDLLILAAQEVSPAEPFAAPSVRGIALDPARFDGQTVTVAGRFRGRNLFGDQPAAPGRSRYDFVIQLADASVWVTGRRPRGNGIDLDVDARVDTGRWVEVQGDVRSSKGQVWIEAIAVRATTAAIETTPTETQVAAPPAPPPHVIFSTPTAGEVDVATTARVRVQFSRDMVGDSFKGNVMVRYRPQEAIERGLPTSTDPVFAATYDAGRRVLELKFSGAFERFRTVEVELGEGIVATDKQPLAPYTLTFTLGG